MAMKYLSKSVEETNKLAQDFLNKISTDFLNIQTKKGAAVVVGLFGDLGSGKTTFTQALGKCLGVPEVMTSPTFVIMKKYGINQDPAFGIPKAWPWLNLIHIDAYRLDSGKELQSLNFKEISEDPNNLILIEWPERVADIMPSDLVKINFKFISEFEREIDF
jgi:tRNA threonylcarbamoyladenosine biosynthesis protein TsaE